MPETLDWGPNTIGALLDRVDGLLGRRERVIIGVAGAPGAGKSTLSEALLPALRARLGTAAVAVVPMDGFHLAQSVIEERGWEDVKGAPHTFDAAGYVALLHRLRAERSSSVFAPEFRRTLDDAVAGAIEVPPACRVVVTEGNYLLLDSPPWRDIAELLHETWFVRLDDATRIERLVARHIEFKDDPATARRRAETSDQANADLVAPAAARAALIIDMA